MTADEGSLLWRALPLLGTVYLVSLALQPPPAKWVGIACLAVLAPLFAGWIAGRVAGAGPWATEE